jgi:hypothetical protein
MRQMWREAQEHKRRFLRACSDVEISELRKHSKELKRVDVGFIWLDELLIGIEVRDNDKRQVYYDEDLRQAAKKETRARKGRASALAAEQGPRGRA